VTDFVLVITPQRGNPMTAQGIALGSGRHTTISPEWAELNGWN